MTDPIREAEVEKTRKALRRHEANVSRMHDAVRASGGCCPACAFGREYDKAATKVHRVETWLAHLLEREKPLKRERSPCDHAWALRAICVALGLPEDESTGNIVRAVDSAVERKPGPVCPTCESGGWSALLEASQAKIADVQRRLDLARARVKELEAELEALR